MNHPSYIIEIFNIIRDRRCESEDAAKVLADYLLDKGDIRGEIMAARRKLLDCDDENTSEKIYSEICRMEEAAQAALCPKWKEHSVLSFWNGFPESLVASEDTLVNLPERDYEVFRNLHLTYHFADSSPEILSRIITKMEPRRIQISEVGKSWNEKNFEAVAHPSVTEFFFKQKSNPMSFIIREPKFQNLRFLKVSTGIMMEAKDFGWLHNPEVLPKLESLEVTVSEEVKNLLRATRRIEIF